MTALESVLGANSLQLSTVKTSLSTIYDESVSQWASLSQLCQALLHEVRCLRTEGDVVKSEISVNIDRLTQRIEKLDVNINQTENIPLMSPQVRKDLIDSVSKSIVEQVLPQLRERLLVDIGDTMKRVLDERSFSYFSHLPQTFVDNFSNQLAEGALDFSMGCQLEDGTAVAGDLLTKVGHNPSFVE